MFDQEEDEDVESAEWGSGVWLFCKSGKAHQDTHIEHLMSLGLAYSRWIFRLTGDEQKDSFIRHDDTAVINHMETDFITTAFHCLGRNPARENVALLPKTGPPFEYKVKADAELDIPDAWQWAHPRAPPLRLSDSAVKGLRDWGYVFWDLDRLRESGILDRRYVYFFTV